MDLIIVGIYIWAGAMANSYLKHNLLKIQTAYVFNLQKFILEKIIMAFILGWLTIPLAIILKLCGVGKQNS